MNCVLCRKLERVDGQEEEWMGRWVNGWMGGWMDGWVDGWMDG